MPTKRMRNNLWFNLSVSTFTCRFLIINGYRQEPVKLLRDGISVHPLNREYSRHSGDVGVIIGRADAEKVFRRIWCKLMELRECFYVLFLHRGNKVLGYYLVSVGGLTVTVEDFRTIFQAVLKANACSVIFAHNHPSGNAAPSTADLEMTKKLKEAGKILETIVLDHLIILPEGYCSMADEGQF